MSLFDVSEDLDRISSRVGKEIAYLFSINVWPMTCKRLSKQQHLAWAFKFNPISHKSSANLRSNCVQMVSVDIFDLSNNFDKIISNKLRVLKNCLVLGDVFLFMTEMSRKSFQSTANEIMILQDLPMTTVSSLTL